MLIHFLQDYKVIGRQGDKIRIKGIFPGLKQEEFVFLNNEVVNEEHTYRIEPIEYNEAEGNLFKAVIAAEQFGFV